MVSCTSVLVLYNLPGTLAAQQQGVGSEADEGVLHEVAAVLAALAKLSIPARSVGVRTLADVHGVLTASPEPCVFNLVESLAGALEDVAAVPAICRAAGKAFTGNGERPQLLCLDKHASKLLLAGAGLAVPCGWCIGPADPLPAPDGAVIVKPLQTDASEGIDAAAVLPAGDAAALAQRIAYVHGTFDQPALVESFIDGRELNVSVLEFPEGPRVMPLAEIEFIDFAPDQPRIVGYAAKWDQTSHAFNHTPRRIPAGLPEGVADTVRRAALLAWRTLGCSGYARVDFRLDQSGTPYVLEVNPNPDISPDAGFAAAIDAGGIPYERFVSTMLDLAMARQSAAAPPPAAAPCPSRPSPVGQNGVTVARLDATHREAVMGLLKATSFFHDHELMIAAEVIDEALAKGPDGDYQSFVAIARGGPVGWVCFGRTPCTASTWDVYWLAVAPVAQGGGVGRRLMTIAEEWISAAGGTLAIIETAGRPHYAPTRAFYQRLGYNRVAEIPDFYGPGDAKVVFTRSLP